MSVRITVTKNGPYVFEGELDIVRPDGTKIPASARGALCRCGRSQNKPFCDGSHARTGWTE